MIKQSKVTENASVYIHNANVVGRTFNIVSWRCIKNGKPSGKTFSKHFARDSEAESFYEEKG